MDLSDLLKMGATAFIASSKSGNTGSSLDLGSLSAALLGLSRGSNGNGSLDIGDILGEMQSGGMADIAQSWLGDGNNADISDNQITEIFGDDRITDFASKLGLDQKEAVGGLRDALPQMVDNASTGGSLLDSIGGIDGAISMASKIFGR